MTELNAATGVFKFKNYGSLDHKKYASINFNFEATTGYIALSAAKLLTFNMVQVGLCHKDIIGFNAAK